LVSRAAATPTLRESCAHTSQPCGLLVSGQSLIVAGGIAGDLSRAVKQDVEPVRCFYLHRTGSGLVRSPLAKLRARG